MTLGLSRAATLELQVEHMREFFAVARRAWLQPADVLNTLSLDKLRAYLRSRPKKH